MVTRSIHVKAAPLIALAALCLLSATPPVHAATTHVYYADGNAIYGYNILTAISQVVLSSPALQPIELRTDQANGHIYFNSGTSVSATIQRIDLNGANPTLIYQGGATHSILNIALDTVNGRLYDSEPEENRITRVDDDGTGIISFVTTSNANGLEVDPAGGKFYYTERFGDYIRRVDLNGTGMQTLISPATDPTVVEPWTISLATIAGKLYFAGYNTTGSVTYHIQRSNLDGTGFENLLTLSGVPRALRVDEQAGLMYWAEGSTLRRANLDGTGAVTLLAHTSTIRGVTMVNIPEPATLSLLALAWLPLLRRRRKPGQSGDANHTS